MITREFNQNKSDEIKMSRGGKREGAGRKPGSLGKRTQEIVAAASQHGITPLEYMLQILRDPAQPFEERFKAAIQAAPYIHPRLSSVQHKDDDRRHANDMSDAELTDIASGRGDRTAAAQDSSPGPDQLH